MPMDDLFQAIKSISRDEYYNLNNPTGVIGMAPVAGLGELRDNDMRLSSDSTKRHFLMGFSAWGADSEGNSDLVGE